MDHLFNSVMDLQSEMTWEALRAVVLTRVTLSRDVFDVTAGAGSCRGHLLGGGQGCCTITLSTRDGPHHKEPPSPKGRSEGLRTCFRPEAGMTRCVCLHLITQPFHQEIGSLNDYSVKRDV